MGSLSPWHWAILAVVVILLFGAKKLPDAARSLGKSMRIFKSEIREMQSENKPENSALGTQSDAPAANPTPVQSQRVEPPAPSEQGHSEARPA
ncbi:Sec-independent protein translocase subunit TatA [Mycobacterium intracellulare]|uniref:Sec-independent protein translocase protein TatA n=1 Tax=Mycobacterium intracellulare TaxID=1767 RepID=A0AAE4RBC6_MYCIT|nr:Sec-independent protein translocase subunit TatA [Mycobacterium intracellulare]MCA2319054.1 Sec-independent protein translocase subunit TatA [Mycobacterium intracellulare]MCA2339684.1 Sec-independent protein translocase subunit TatA [Mycobacterium intracellulare]MDV6975654.1 Sec-independent protein translocase subunit TatA [Mycobacterium intracellulare]MDV6982013.1 Sec-independent protein translocase subunit TatA [Mycobacterium intracellulare]MDV7011123.1 Sec-independent protein translocase